MSAAGGGLPQRQPRASRRHSAASADAEASQAAATAGSCETPVNPQAQVPIPSFGTGGGRDQAVMGAAAHADTCGAAAAAVPDGNATVTDGASPAWASERHTGGPLRSAKVDHYDFEYLDHTADIQIHSWGATHAKAFEQAALAMFNYMTPLEGLAVDESCTRTYEASGHDMHTLLFSFLDELLFVFSTELFAPKLLDISHFDQGGWHITATGRGEVFDRQRHVSGTEVKAITYSAMDVRQCDDEVEVFVIVDI